MFTFYISLNVRNPEHFNLKYLYIEHRFNLKKKRKTKYSFSNASPITCGYQKCFQFVCSLCGFI